MEKERKWRETENGESRKREGWGERKGERECVREGEGEEGKRENADLRRVARATAWPVTARGSVMNCRSLFTSLSLSLSLSLLCLPPFLPPSLAPTIALI
jgi:hypothetical protein